MFRKIKELQSLLTASRKALANAEDKIVQRDHFIHKETVKHQKQSELVEQITRILYSNNYGRPDIYLNKLKELVHDYQSQN